MADITIPEAIAQLLGIVDRLASAHGHRKKFSLDGRLVGDIGEILVEQAYEVELLPGLAKRHDAKCADGRLVQIKATMKGESLTFPAKHTPDYYLGVLILPDGTFKTIFNGPGAIAARAVEKRSSKNTSLHSVRLAKLQELDKHVNDADRVPLRPSLAAPAIAEGA